MNEAGRQMRGQWRYLIGAALLTVPAFILKLGVLHASVGFETVLYGLAILGAAFLLSWAAEVAQMDISQGLALAFLAFIAVLPEYAVDLVFAWKAGAEDARGAGIDPCLGRGLLDPCNRHLAIANMTGANRLLIGIGWATVVLVWWKRSGEREVTLPETRRIDLGYMFLATVWALTIVVRETANVFDTVVLVALFGAYIWHAAHEEQEHPELIGPPLAISMLPTGQRRSVTLALFVFAAIAILVAAEPFAHGLVEVGKAAGISPFLLVQWLAPLASEAPEMIIAVLFVLRNKPHQGLGTLVSSKVNQWTLLVGSLPLVYAISFGSLTHQMHLGGRQVEEVLLTAAQSLFAAAVLANLSISRVEAAGLLVLFLAQFGFEDSRVRFGFAAAYFLLFLLMLAKDAGARRALWLAVKRALSKPSRAPAR